MKYLVILALLTFQAMPASALNCVALTDTIKSIMEARQAGLPMEDLMGAIQQSPNREVRGALSIFIYDAFTWPIENAPEARQEAIFAFARTSMLDCLNGEIERMKRELSQ